MSEQEISSETTSGTHGAQGEAKVLGLQRWVQMAFTAFALLLFWVLDKIITIIWDRFAEPTPELVTLIAAVLGAGATMVLYRNPRVSRIAQEIVAELAKVSWPSRRETQVSTIVVIVTSLIAAMIVGAFDAAWSKLTDLIYKV
jgi:preprotein translocase subunit SecE